MTGRHPSSQTHRRSVSVSAAEPTTTAESPFGDENQVVFRAQQQSHRPSASTVGEDISPRTAQSASIENQVVPDSLPSSSPFADMPSSRPTSQSGSGSNKNSMTPSSSQFFDEHYSPQATPGPTMPDAASPPPVGEYSPTQELHEYPTHIAPEQSPVSPVGESLSPPPLGGSGNGNGQLYAPRPTFARGNSEEPLLHDISGANTPVDGSRPDPFDNGDLTPVSPHSSRATSPDLEAIGPNSLAPKIHINSIPNTPDPAHVATFDARQSFATPFRDQPSISSASVGKKVSIAENPVTHESNNRYSDGSASGTGFTAGAGTLSTIAARRSQRMKNQQERLSGMGGGKKGWGAGAAGDKVGKDGKPAGPGTNRKPFQSTRLKGEIYKPWLEKKDPAQRWARWITIVSIILGIGAAAALCYDGYASVPKLGKTCLVLEDNFETLNLDNWQREVRLDGYDNGEFQWTTNSDNNSFVEDGILYLTPTLTSDHLGEEAISNGYTLNLTQDGTCTSTNVSQCVAVSNTSRLTVINPVMSARLITKNTHSIKYGKVEVRAKFPTGDWLWPSIFMLPVEETYGRWPRSGEIDIVTGRGNNASYPTRGVDFAQSALHWGPTVDLDRLWMTWGYREQRRTYYNQQWHTYGLEWNEEYLWTYIDSRVAQVISLRFKDSFWTKGKFPSTITNTTTGEIQRLTNPWIASENNVAPFDQPFYLILNLAVGATNGWFPDGEGGKPWIDNSGTAMTDFWAAKDRWWNNWPSDRKERGFAIDSVKMWKTC